MVVDTSALLAILFGKPERAEFIERISVAGVRLICSVSALEAAIVVGCRKGPAGVRELDLLMHAAQLDVVPFDGQQLLLAREAYQRYGKSRHAAGLNLGDCCSYALAKSSGEELLFKGSDFAQTDLPSVPK